MDVAASGHTLALVTPAPSEAAICTSVAAQVTGTSAVTGRAAEPAEAPATPSQDKASGPASPALTPARRAPAEITEQLHARGYQPLDVFGCGVEGTVYRWAPRFSIALHVSDK